MKKLFFVLPVIVATVFASCKKDDNTPEPIQPIPYQKIAEGYAAGAAVKVELYAKEALTTGYNTVYIALHDSTSAAPITNASLTLKPMMDMGTMKHSSPVEQPNATATDRLFAGAIVFTMPSGTMGSWTVDVNLNVAGKQGIATLPVSIAQPTVPRLKSFVSKADSAKYFVAFLQPNAPKVGVNDIEIAIFKSASMMSFPADSSLAIALTPEMPTMNHGSPNNVDPVHIGKGHYKGKVNFTMTGLWYLHLDFMQGSAVADTATYFEVNF